MLEFCRTKMKASNAKAAIQVPMLDLSRQYAGLREQFLAAVERVCDSQKYILGEEVTAFEREFATLCGSTEAVGCASGTDALWLGLVAAGVKPGDTVITSPFSFFATASSIIRAGARPVFADVDPETLNIDPVKVEQGLRSGSPHRHAIMPVHLYGQCADMDALTRIATEFKLAVVEDAAQASGATWNGRPAGSLGVAAAFSFYPTKNLSAFGDAGALTTSDAKLAEHARSLRNHGAKQRYYHDEIGANSRLDSIQATVLRVKMPHLGEWNDARRNRASAYDKMFAAAGLTKVGAECACSCHPAKDPAASTPHLSPICDSCAETGPTARLSERTWRGQRGLLSGTAAFAKMLFISWLSARVICRKPSRLRWTFWPCPSFLNWKNLSSGMWWSRLRNSSPEPFTAD